EKHEIKNQMLKKDDFEAQKAELSKTKKSIKPENKKVETKDVNPENNVESDSQDDLNSIKMVAIEAQTAINLANLEAKPAIKNDNDDGKSIKTSTQKSVNISGGKEAEVMSLKTPQKLSENV